jgi:anti-anti-sigma regulatory factor
MNANERLRIIFKSLGLDLFFKTQNDEAKANPKPK